MPSVSKKQHNFMAAVAKNPKFAKKAGVPQSVGEDFLEADKGKKFRMGGTTNPMRAGINKQTTHHGMMQMPNASLKKFRGFKEGGAMESKKEMREEMKADKAQDKAMIKKAVGMHDKQQHGGKKTNLAGLKSGGRIAAKGIHPIQKQSKRGALEVKMCGGGMTKKTGRGR